MNKPFRLAPAAGSVPPLVEPAANNIGAASTRFCESGETVPNPTGEAGAPNLSTPSMPCRECDGKGEAEYLALDAIRPHWAACHKCHGSGREAPYCETCGGQLTVDGFCYSCDDWGSLVYVERIAPGRIAC